MKTVSVSANPFPVYQFHINYFNSSNHFFYSFTLYNIYISFLTGCFKAFFFGGGVWGGYGNKVVVISFVSVFQLLVLFVF